MKEIIKVYIKHGESNVALLNWDYLASALMPSLANSYANWAVPNARQVNNINKNSELMTTAIDVSVFSF